MNINVLILKILKRFFLHWAFENLSIEEVGGGGGGIEGTQVTLSLPLPPPSPPPTPPAFQEKPLVSYFKYSLGGEGGRTITRVTYMEHCNWKVGTVIKKGWKKYKFTNVAILHSFSVFEQFCMKKVCKINN